MGRAGCFRGDHPMRPLTLLSIVVPVTLLCCWPAAAEPPAGRTSPATPALYEFRATATGVVLRQLARQANVPLVVSEAVAGTTTLRFEEVSARRAIDVVAAAQNLVVVDVGGILLVQTPKERGAELHALDSPSFPAAMARYQRRYFEALCREGFSEAQALAIVATQRPPIADVAAPKP